MKALEINTESWEDLADDCKSWRTTLRKQLRIDQLLKANLTLKDAKRDLAYPQQEETNLVQTALSQVCSEEEKRLKEKDEEITSIRRRMQVRITKLEDQYDQLRMCNSSLEKAKAKLANEIKKHIIVQDLTKRNRQPENENAGLLRRVDELTAQDATLRNENIALEQNVQRLREANAKLTQRNDNLQIEHKTLSDQLREANLHLKYANRELADLRQLRAQLEAALNQLRSEMENRLKEKDGETQNIRKSSARVIEELQRTLVEVEARYKTEIYRLKKKIEADTRELETDLDNANRATQKYLKQMKSLQIRVKELETLVEDERRAADDLRNQLAVSERKSVALTQELEDARALLEDVHVLKRELENAARRERESVANELKAERLIKEMQAQMTEERHQLAKLSSLNYQLQIDIKTYRRQLKESEDVADLTMNKYHKAQALIEEADQQADVMEKNLQSVQRQIRVIRL